MQQVVRMPATVLLSVSIPRTWSQQTYTFDRWQPFVVYLTVWSPTEADYDVTLHQRSREYPKFGFTILNPNLV